MRLFDNTKEAYEQVLRDLVKFGREVKSNTMQNKRNVGDEYLTKELQCYSFGVLDDSDKLATCSNPQWVLEEIGERVAMPPQNPGQAWKLREETWTPFMTDGKFCYTYGQRIARACTAVIELLKDNPESRQGILSMWRDIDHYVTNGVKRVPCSMYYNLQIREGKVDMIYHMRSSDYFTHFKNDFTLASLLKEYIAEQVGVPAGTTFMVVDSLHAYKKDWKELNIF